VVGRPIRTAPDPVAMVKTMHREITRALPRLEMIPESGPFQQVHTSQKIYKIPTGSVDNPVEGL
jgi:hypothetical protein